MIKVYHADEPTFTSVAPKAFPSGFTLVAEVESDNLGLAFERTNHIDQAWFENRGVKVIVRSRSTSVGDVFVLADGSRVMVASLGFEPLTVA